MLDLDLDYELEKIMRFRNSLHQNNSQVSKDTGLIFQELGLFDETIITCPTPIKAIGLTGSPTERFFRKFPANTELSFNVIGDQVRLTIPKNTLLSPHFEIYSLHGGWFSREDCGLLHVGENCYPHSLYLIAEDGRTKIINGAGRDDILYASLAQQLLIYPLSWQVEFIQAPAAALETMKAIAIICRSALWQGKGALYGSSGTLPPIVIEAVNSTSQIILTSSPDPLTSFAAIFESVASPDEYELTAIYDHAKQGLLAPKILAKLYPHLYLNSTAEIVLLGAATPFYR
jgi:hypothetical protein